LGTQQLFGIRVATVEKTSATRTLRIPGKITLDETRVYPIKAAVDGFVKETQEDKVGSHVKKDQRLAYIYSPEFLSAAGAYLAIGGGTQGGTGKEGAAGTQSVSAAQNWANRLRSLGISDVQIKEFDSTHTIPEYMYVVSPVDGFILARNTFPGLRFEKNMEFYRIADLSHVWIIADLFASDRYNFRPGAVARIALLDQKARFSARVSDILPEADTTTHTLKLLLEAENRNLALRPGMFVDVELTFQARPGLSVPDDAVIDTGLSKRVFVERGNGNFELRQVETGEHFGNRVQILGGLAQGDRVVVSGTFLVDSESRLRSLVSVPSAAGTSGAKSDHMHDHTTEAQPGAGHAQ
jgi:Cu(I)/Ag(I) efflux system membrane fusion protein